VANGQITLASCISYVVGHGGRSHLGPDFVVATALGWLGYQHTLTRILWLAPCKGSILVVELSRWQLQVSVSHGLMTLDGLMFGKIIGTVGVASTKNVKLALVSLITDPVKMHIYCFGAFLFDGVIDDATSGTVIHLQWGCRLWVFQFVQGNAHGAYHVCIEEKGTKFSFSSTGNNLAHDLV